MRFFVAKINTKDLDCLRDLLKSGAIAQVIDRRHPLSEAAEAVHYREAGHARGKVVIVIEQTGMGFNLTGDLTEQPIPGLTRRPVLQL